MKRLAWILAGLSLLTAACAPGSKPQAAGKEKPLVVATIFPDYDFARRVAGDRFEVKLLLPPGVEAHSYEPTPSDIAAISRAAVFVYTGEGMEPWALDLARAAGNPGLRVVDASAGIALIEGRHHEEAEEAHGKEGEEGQGEEELDPHVWLDPTLAARMATTIAEGLAAADPAGRAIYAANAEDYGRELLALDSRIAAGLAGAKSRTIVYGGHFAFGYFARRYGLDHVSPYGGFSPDAEPTPRAVAELIRVLKATGSPVVFHEELLEPRVARVLAEGSGARLELLHGAHNVSAAELGRGITYLSIMEDNLRKLREALGAP